MRRAMLPIGAAITLVLLWWLFLWSPLSPSRATRVVRFLEAPDVGGGWSAIIEQFERLHPDIEVRLEEGPAATNLREDMYATSFRANSRTYDLAYLDVVWVPRFASQGWIVPLDSRFAPRAREDFLPGDLEGSTWEGKTYRVPMQSDAGMLYYRKDLLAEAGERPPETWDDLERIAQRLSSRERAGFVFEGSQYEGLICTFLEALWGNGGEVLDEKGRVAIDSESAVAALAWLVSLVQEKRLAPEAVATYQEEEARHAFQQGRAVFMRNWPYAWRLLNAKDSPVRGKVGLCPMVHSDDHSSAAALGGWGFGLARGAKDPEAAWEFVEFATGPKGQRILHERNGVLPARRSLYQDHELLTESPFLADVYRVLLTARPRPVHARYAEMSDILQRHVSAAIVGKEPPREALSQAGRELRALLGEEGAP